jgi:hypothetical protein
MSTTATDHRHRPPSPTAPATPAIRQGAQQRCPFGKMRTRAQGCAAPRAATATMPHILEVLVQALTQGDVSRKIFLFPGRVDCPSALSQSVQSDSLTSFEDDSGFNPPTADYSVRISRGIVHVGHCSVRTLRLNIY